MADGITEQQMAVLLQQDNQTLAEWCNELNCWRWPAALPDPESAELWDERWPNRTAIMQWIDDRVGHKFVLRVHNKDMSDEVFESFWRRDRAPGTPYGDYLKHRADARMQRMREREDEILSSEFIVEDVFDDDLIDA